MTKAIFSIIVLIHGLIHLLGFVKAFNIAPVTQLTKAISKPLGMVWLITGILFVAVLILYLLNKNYWPIIAAIAMVLSQVLIIAFWTDAKFGTIANILVLVIALPSFGDFLFQREIKMEQRQLLLQTKKVETTYVSKEAINRLPPIVQQWLLQAKVVDKPLANFVRLRQKGEMKSSADGDWMSFTAQQYFDASNPSFIWTTRVNMNPFIHMTGRDKFQDGKGEMLIKVFSLINVVNDSNNEKINSGSMLRYLGEICWFPSAAMNEYIRWEEVDATSARAIFTYKGESVAGLFKFQESGEMISFEADRFFGGGEDASLERWIVTATGHKEINNYHIPYKHEVTWKLKDGDFLWLKLEITDLEVNNFCLYE